MMAGEYDAAEESVRLCGDVQHVCRNLSLILTAQPDPQALTDCLAAFLNTLGLCGRLLILRPIAESGLEGRQLQCLYGASGPDLVDASEFPGVWECFREGRPIETVQGNSLRYHQPIEMACGVRLCLVLDGFRPDAGSSRFLADVADLAGNLYRLHAQSERDALTGLLNRQVFDRKLSRIQEALAHPRCRRGFQDSASFLALVDVDHFKRINDHHGHLYGDEVLLGLARLMERNFRHNDDVFRYGGEEFAVILTQLGEDQAGSALERLRARVMDGLFPQIGGMTISIGYCRLEAGPPAKMIERADKALYYCKNNGRNRVMGYAHLVAAGKLSEKYPPSDIELF